jgi:hypothetical protein
MARMVAGRDPVCVDSGHLRFRRSQFPEIRDINRELLKIVPDLAFSRYWRGLIA